MHLRLDLRQILLGDRRHEIDVVIKPVFDDGTDREFAGGIDGFKRLCQNVRAGMAIDVQPLLVFERDDFQSIPLFEYAGKIRFLPVDLRADRISRQALGNRRGGLHTGRFFLHLHTFAVLQNDIHR